MKIEAIDPALSVNNTYNNTQQPLQNSSPSDEVDKNDGLRVGEVKKAVDRMNQQLQQDQRDVRYKVHEKTHRILVQVIDHKTDKVISEIPPSKILDMIASFEEENRNVAINKKV